MRTEQFRQYLEGKGLSDRTVTEYVKWCRRLHRWLDRDPADVTPQELRGWAETVPQSWSSRKTARTSVKHLLVSVGRDPVDAHAIRVPRKPKPKPKPLSPDDARMLRDTAVMVGGREGLATLTILYTAARAGEVARLRWDGISDAEVRWWRPKVSDWHEVPLHPILQDAFDRWDRPREGFVFQGDRGRPHVCATTVWTWVRKVGDIAGIDVCPKKLRATAGSTALEATRDLDAVAELLGHQDPATTRAYYTTTSQKRLEAAVAALDY